MTESTAAIPQPTLTVDRTGSCELLLIRHGRSADVVPGSPESTDPPLHVEGQRQADALGRRLASIPLAAVYSSHLARAHQTALAIALHHRLDVVIHEDLEEVKLGDWGNGEFRRRAATQDPEFVAWAATGRWDGIPNAETDDALRTRVGTIVDTLVERHQGERIAVVAHGGAINAVLARMLGTHRSLWMTAENTGVTVVRVTGDRSTLVTLNDTHHLYDPVLGG